MSVQVVEELGWVYVSHSIDDINGVFGKEKLNEKQDPPLLLDLLI